MAAPNFRIEGARAVFAVSSLRKLTLLVCFLGLGVCLSVAAETPKVPAWATTQLSDWFAAYNSQDANAISRFYAEGAVLRPFGKAPIRGQTAIREHYKKGLASDVSICSGAFTRFKAANDIAVGWGYDHCVTQATGAQYDARWMLVWERDAAGRWTITQDIDEGP